MNLNRLAGVIMVVLGGVLGIIIALWLFTNEGLEGSARILGLGIALLILVAPLIGAGIYLTTFGGQQAQQEQEAGRQRKLLNIVQSRGQVKLDDLIVEMQLPRDQVRDMIHSLVGLGVFSGYVNWDDGGTLYSSDAKHLRDLKSCPNCGGEITLSGKGVAKCRFCNTEFFLS